MNSDYRSAGLCCLCAIFFHRAASVGFTCAISGSDKEAREIASSPVFFEWTSAACEPRIQARNPAQL